MPLIDEVTAKLNVFGDHGWKDLFLRHGLDISAANLAAELARPLNTIDRTIPGFEDFALHIPSMIYPTILLLMLTLRYREAFSKKDDTIEQRAEGDAINPF